jgi:hypothetical protein
MKQGLKKVDKIYIVRSFMISALEVILVLVTKASRF